MQKTNAGEASPLISSMGENWEDPEPSGRCNNNSFNSFLKNQSNKKINIKTILDFRNKYFPKISDKQWNNWQWQIKNSITEYRKLKLFFQELENLENNGQFDELIAKKLPFRITPYYAAVAYNSKNIKKCVIPSSKELIISKGESIDPLNEDHDMSVNCVVHRYPDRVLFLSTSFCSVNCRYCTRSRIVASKKNIPKQKQIWDNAFKYINENKEIRDVIISGGDPLTLNDNALEYILFNLRKIPHIEIIRIGTKVPVVLPMRINTKLVKMLKKYHPLYLSIHFTHPDEITEEVKNACELLANNGFPLGSQTVLLKDINDNPDIMKKLVQKLLFIRVKPYYLYQCDPIIGSSHFRTPVSKGIEIIENLRGWTSGYAIPHFVIDAPGGGGKIPLLPEYKLGLDEDNYLKLRNYENKTFLYYDCN